MTRLLTHPLFYTYYRHAPVPLRQLAANLLPSLLPKPLVRTANLPSFARVTVTAQPRRRMVHVLAYVPERRGEQTDMIEEPVELRDVTVELRLGGRQPRRVYLAPHNTSLPFTVVRGYLRVTLPVVPGHAMVVVEE